jgi:hypothetical protein
MAENCPPASTLSCTATNSITTAVIAASAFQTTNLVHNLTSADLEKYYKANPEVASSIPKIISTAEAEIKKHLRKTGREPRVTVYLSPDPEDESRLNIVFRVRKNKNNSSSYSRLLKVWDRVCEVVYSKAKAKEVAEKISIILTI